MIEILPGLFAFKGSYAGFTTYAYALGGEGPILIDTLMKGGASKSILPALGRLGWRPQRVILTHGHADHFGGLQEVVKAFPEIKVCAHSSDAPWIENTDAFLDGLYRDYGDDAGFVYNEDRIKWVETLIGSPITVSESLEEGQVFDTGTFAVEVIHLPGHTAGHIGLVDTERRFAIIGDAIIGSGILDNEGRCSWPPVYVDLDDYKLTITKLRELNVHSLLSGHYLNLQGTEMEEFISESEQYVSRCDKTVRAELKASSGGLSYIDLVSKVNQSLGPYLNGGVAGFPCVLAHIKELEQESNVAGVRENGHIRWMWRS